MTIPTVVDKATVAQVLRDISLLLQLQGESGFRVRAYDMAADRIAGLPQELGPLVAEGRLESLPGIGRALAEKISELVSTGRLGYLEELRAQFPPGLLELTQLPDVGPKKVATLWRELQVSSIEELERACREGRVRQVRGFGAKSEAKMLEGIALYRRARGERKLLGEVLPVATALLERVKAAPGVVRASLGGSVRRQAETVADVDIIASAPEAGPVLDALANAPGVAAVLGKGESKCSVRLEAGDLQVDLRVLPDEDFATALHHFTGSKAHHIRLRNLGQERGLKISEWGVHRDDGTKVPVTDESGLYALLDMQYVPPELREDNGEVEAAREGQLPQDLLTLEDVQGAVHAHSTWSDGRNSLEEMALAARALGLKYLTVTEHSEAAIYAGGLKVDDLKRQWEEIDRINAAVSGVRLLKGIEVDILESGALDYADSVLEQLEVVIGSIHVRHGMDEDQMTRRLLAAMDNPCLQILGHPTGRLINSREPYPVRMDEVLERAAERGVAVEVNGKPARLDIKAEYVRQAVKRGVRLVVSCDAHQKEDLRNLAFAVATARRGWARKGDVLNTLPTDRFVTALRERR
ncbi:DNA polymerase/3'-5' exonuclease PolX [Myxococcus xanthus]|uniref:DNA polymerase/3'-5' exonuclease PolX n=1 Tax=Myxococcus xanthus TaxID=34 RepID=UPI000344F1EE|nr:DNA polymerase/3'-5' exonuclease PolX [Myxococcus xanthus]QVW71866.1 DNA polymerase/3'-5' exonuclease PolX [Myxococcus xanthus DZ2]UEO08653.1 DNA polymerase/3'-5' exonuclease PolX [Myxococcus xanthus DZ2]UYI18417.1 DNA polymerase/3'-5' exonuclease PolX [Myxococcus xanthus]UYI25847.1 DNA polymerase/3'-5' exonuclease PolX [Myxococcus xanthus]